MHEMLMAIEKRGELSLTKRDLRRLKRARQEATALSARREDIESLDDAIAVDSGASVSLMKNGRWLKDLDSQVRATIRTATGEKTQTEAHGPLRIRTRDSKGTTTELKKIGDAHLLHDLTFSLLSVSQLTKCGCTITFNPKEGFLITPDGTKVKFKQRKGLYFMPTAKGRKSRDRHSTRGHQGSTKDTRARAVKTPSSTEGKVKSTMKMLKHSDYHPTATSGLRLDVHCMIAGIGANHAAQRL